MKIIKAQSSRDYEIVLRAFERIMPHAVADFGKDREESFVNYYGFEVVQQIIACAKIIQNSNKTITVQYLIIEPILRYQGFLEKFLRAIEGVYQLQGFESVHITVPVDQVNTYLYLGYQPYGKTDNELVQLKKILVFTFDTQFARVYDYIFPLTQAKRELLDQFILPNDSLLDVGCAAGEVGAVFKGKLGYYLGIDISERMIENALDKQVNAQVLDMAQIESLQQTFDKIICIGNALVFVETMPELELQIQRFSNCLKPDGELLIQIINYSHVIAQNVTQLPTIKDASKKCQLERRYKLKKDNEQVEFRLSLHVGRSRFNETVTLLALQPQQLIDCLQAHHFDILASYGSFTQQPLDFSNSQSCLIWAKKRSM